MIRRSIARDEPRKAPKQTKEEKAKIMKNLKPDEIYIKVPRDFAGSRADYIMWLREEKKIAEEIKNGTSTVASRRK